MAGVGRPTVMTEEVIAKLEYGFACDMTDLQACFFAGISKDAYYDRRKADREFADRIDGFKDSLKMKAKMVIHKNIVEKEDVDTAEWFLERREKESYSTRNEQTGANGDPLMPLQTITLETVRVIKQEDVSRESTLDENSGS